MEKIFIIGNPGAAYRPGLVAKYFIDRADQYNIQFFDPEYFFGIPNLFRGLFLFLLITFHVLCSHTLVIMPLRHSSRYGRFAIRVAKVLKRRVITDIYISAYETKVLDRKRVKKNSRKAKRAKNDDIRAMEYSNPAVFLTKAEREYYCNIVGVNKEQINSIISPLVSPLREQANLPYLRAQSARPTIAWWGRMGNPLHGLELIIEAIRILNNEGFQADYAIFGANDRRYTEIYEKNSDIADLENVLFTHEYSFNNGKLGDFLLQNTDLALGTFGDTKKAKTALVNKVLDAASFGIPCLTQKSEGMLEYFSADKNISLSEIDAQSLAERIKQVLSDKNNLLKIGEASRQVISMQFTSKHFESRLSHILTGDYNGLAKISDS